MKRIFFFLCVMLFCSCDREEQIYDCSDPSYQNLMDGGWISGVNLYCVVDNSRPNKFVRVWDKSVKTVNDYVNFYLVLEIGTRAINSEIQYQYEDFLISYVRGIYRKKKAQFIIDEHLKSCRQGKDVSWPLLFTAYINGEITIECDKVLFGEQPGTNLSSHFNLLSYKNVHCLPIGVENPQILYNFGDDFPQELNKYFQDKTWLLEGYNFAFADQPTEKYDEITLRVTCPLIKEDAKAIATAIYKGTDIPSNTETVYTAECKIKFEWE